MSGLDISAFYSRNLRVNKDKEEEEGLLRSVFILNNRVLHEGGQLYLKPRSLNPTHGEGFGGRGDTTHIMYPTSAISSHK